MDVILTIVVGVLCFFTGVGFGLYRLFFRSEGILDVRTDQNGSKTVTLDLGDSDPYDLDKSKYVVFRVRSKRI